MAVCNKDCFNCPFPDCVLDELDAEDYRKAKEVDDLLHPQTKHQKKLAAQQRAYYEANRDKVAAQQRAYREANRDKLAAQQRAYYEANRDKVACRRKEKRTCTPITTASSSASASVS